MLSDKVVSAVQSALVDAGFLAADSFTVGSWDRNTASAYDYFIYNKLPPVPVELRGFAPLSPTGLHESVVELLGGWDEVLAIDEEDSEDAEASDYDNDGEGDTGDDNDDEVVIDPSEHSDEDLGVTVEDATVTDGEQASEDSPQEEAPTAAEETVEDTSDAEEAPVAEEAAGDEETKEESDANTEVSDAPADEVKEDDAPAEETPVKKSSKKNRK